MSQRSGSSSSSSSSSSVSSAENRNRIRSEDDDLETAALLQDGGGGPGLRHRRSSVTNRLTALTDIGGVNSFRSFTKSWRRAAGFAEAIPQRPNFVFAPDQEPIATHDAIEYDPAAAAADVGGEPLEATASRDQPEPARDDGSEPSFTTANANGPGSRRAREREPKNAENELMLAFRVGSQTSASGSVFDVPPHLATPSIIGSYGSFRSYGTTTSSDPARPSMREAAAMWREQQGAASQPQPPLQLQLQLQLPTDEAAPLLVKEVEQDGKMVLTVEGQSTLPQTIFNSINVLVGVGLLSLPLGLKYSGWLVGMVFLFLAAVTTAYTARLLAKCMDLDASLITFSDIAYHSFGSRARLVTSVLFTLELVAACVALIVLFADSLRLLFPGFLSTTEWKVFCFFVLIPLSFLPMRLLSYTSLLGIVACLSIVIIILLDGVIKPTAPGSLIDPARTYVFPANWMTVPLAFGLLMSPWAGHSVFPSIYRDMRHGYKYPKALRVTFCFTYLLDATTAVAGLLMFGDAVGDEITSNILQTSGYPQTLKISMCIFIAIIPLTKTPLNARPITTMLEALLGLQKRNDPPHAPQVTLRSIARAAVAVASLLCFTVVAVIFPSFDSVMAFMGSALSFTICVTLPIAFTLKLFPNGFSRQEKAVMWCTMTVSTVLSVVGTVWAFLPKSIIGAKPGPAMDSL